MWMPRTSSGASFTCTRPSVASLPQPYCSTRSGCPERTRRRARSTGCPGSRSKPAACRWRGRATPSISTPFGCARRAAFSRSRSSSRISRPRAPTWDPWRSVAAFCSSTGTSWSCIRQAITRARSRSRPPSRCRRGGNSPRRWSPRARPAHAPPSSAWISTRSLTARCTQDSSWRDSIWIPVRRRRCISTCSPSGRSCSPRSPST